MRRKLPDVATKVVPARPGRRNRAANFIEMNEFSGNVTVMDPTGTGVDSMVPNWQGACRNLCPWRRFGPIRNRLARLRAALLDWYDRNRRDLPWRRSRDPYAIWVSEVMLQQTRVAAVVEKYQAFMARFPTVFALAMAPEQEVLAHWSGLGYYRRARMLHKAAQVVAATAQGKMPKTAAELRALPGIGGYTAAAIASIAFGEAVAVIDGNVERVLCRIAGWDANGGHRRKVEELAARLVDPLRPGDFNQAMMELGATVCLPRNPQCLVCPVSEDCKTRGEHKTAARARMVSREVGYALCLRQAARGSDREVLLEQRPPAVSVMPGLWELPIVARNAG